MLTYGGSGNTAADMCPDSDVISERAECEDAWNYIESQPDYDPDEWLSDGSGSTPADRFAQLYTSCGTSGCENVPQGCWVHGSGLVQFNPVGDDKLGLTQSYVTQNYMDFLRVVLCKGTPRNLICLRALQCISTNCRKYFGGHTKINHNPDYNAPETTNFLCDTFVKVACL